MSDAAKAQVGLFGFLSRLLKALGRAGIVPLRG
jgi:hypothetical protein